MCPGSDDDFETMAPKPVAPVTGVRSIQAVARGAAQSQQPQRGQQSPQLQERQRSQQPQTQQEPDARASRRAGISLKGRAIGYLSRREHSRLELQRKLAPYIDADDPEALKRVLDELEREGWLSDTRFAQSLVHRRAGRLGARRVLQELRQHGVADDTLAEVGDTLRDSECQRARDVWQKNVWPAARQC